MGASADEGHEATRRRGRRLLSIWTLGSTNVAKVSHGAEPDKITALSEWDAERVTARTAGAGRSVGGRMAGTHKAASSKPQEASSAARSDRVPIN